MVGETTVEVPDEEKKVFVGGLPHDCKHEDVKEHFSKFYLTVIVVFYQIKIAKVFHLT